MTDAEIMGRIIDAASKNTKEGGRPFAAAVVHGGSIIAEGVNTVHVTHDPSSHAEIEAIRAASRFLRSPDLSACRLYVLAVPCLMCATCIVLSKVKKVVYAVGLVEKDKALSESVSTQRSTVEYCQLDNFAAAGVDVLAAWTKRQTAR
ncbi:MAG: nucleoside deaminase [Planctomycetia bacterium]|nr:nucleoside deaminase [Planctomycetia bacterium]